MITEYGLQCFWRKLNKRAPDQCWPLGKVKLGYGYIQLEPFNKYGPPPKTMAAHRASWIIYNGPIPEGMCVCHKCDNPPCCNPYHLFLGTDEDNKNDMITKRRAAFQHPSFRPAFLTI